MTKSPRDPGASPFFSVHVDVVVGLGVGVGLGGGTFFVFKSLDNYKIYILCIDVYIYAKGIVAEQKSYGFCNLVKVGRGKKFKITI